MLQIEKTLTPTSRELPPTKDLGFGHYFTDHWFHCTYTEEKSWHRAQLEALKEFPLHPAAAVLHYGQALFEGMKAFSQKDGRIAVFRPEFNFRRMKEGAERLCLQAPSQEVFMKGLQAVIEADAKWVPKDENGSLYIRPTLVGTEGFLGVRPAKEFLFFIILSPVGSYFASGSAPVKIWVETKALRAAPGGLGATKAGANYAASLQAAQDAKKKGYAQVLWLDVEHAGIEEVGTMNVFFVFKNEICTPSLNGSILPGGVRDSVLELLRSQGRNVSERRITMTEILERYQKNEVLEAFGTGTAAVITPIGELAYQGQSMVLNGNKPGPLSLDLFSQITQIQRGQRPDNLGWMKSLADLS